MEARALNRGCSADPVESHPWLVPFAPWFDETDPRHDGRLDLGLMNSLAAARGLRLDNGRSLRFVAAPATGNALYELTIAETGQVPTRIDGPGMLHDWFNALCWLRWPAIKARLNCVQATAIRAGRVGSVRGPVRDAATLFDESGALFVSEHPSAIAQWRGRDWQGLFVADRQRFLVHVQVLIVGHALLEKLLTPYKGICAQALVAAPTEGSMGRQPPGGSARASGNFANLGAPEGTIDPGDAIYPGDKIDSDGALDPLDALDHRVAGQLDAQALACDRFGPLPLLGVPGWWRGNEDPAFYNDPQVFRGGRHRR